MTWPRSSIQLQRLPSRIVTIWNYKYLKEPSKSSPAILSTTMKVNSFQIFKVWFNSFFSCFILMEQTCEGRLVTDTWRFPTTSPGDHNAKCLDFMFPVRQRESSSNCAHNKLRGEVPNRWGNERLRIFKNEKRSTLLCSPSVVLVGHFSLFQTSTKCIQS